MAMAQQRKFASLSNFVVLISWLSDSPATSCRPAVMSAYNLNRRWIGWLSRFRNHKA